MENEIVKYSEAKEINRIIGSVPVEYQGFETAFCIAGAIRDLRVIFDQKNVRDMIESMMDTQLGFMTDQREGDNFRKPIKYEWAVIKECVIAAIIDGYRITGKEFAILGGGMYPAKNGKYRKIIEFPGLKAFKPTTTPAQFFEEERSGYKGKREMVQLAKVQCFASWILNGEPQKIGYDEDRLSFKIKVNAGMGDDAIIGKALSKLYTRVLMRLTGISVPESDDVYAPEAEILISPNEIREKNGLPTMADEKPKKSVADLARQDEKKFVPPRVCVNPNCPSLDKDGRFLSGCANTDPMCKDPNSPFVGECNLFVQGNANAILSGIDREVRDTAKKELGWTHEVVTPEEKWELIIKIREMGGAK